MTVDIFTGHPEYSISGRVLSSHKDRLFLFNIFILYFRYLKTWKQNADAFEAQDLVEIKKCEH